MTIFEACLDSNASLSLYRRIIPQPSKLVENLQVVFASFQDRFDSPTGDMLFTKATFNAFGRLLSHAENGLLSGEADAAH